MIVNDEDHHGEARPVPLSDQITAWICSLRKHVIENFLVCCFALALLIALAAPTPGANAESIRVGNYKIVSFLNTCTVFFISGLALNLQELHDVVNNLKYFALGILQINFVTTLVALFFLNITFIKEDYRVGIAIFNTVPTTLGVGVALTQLSRGDTVLSLLMTVASNIVGTAIVPFLLSFYLAHSNISTSAAAVKIDPIQLIMTLVLSVLIPTVVGITLRNGFSAIDKQVKTFKVELSMFSSVNLACIVWMALSASRSLLLSQSVTDIVVVLCAAMLVHVFSLVTHHLLTERALHLPLPQAISVTIMASQKSSPVALAVIAGMNVSGKLSGLYTIPCIIGQLCQIFIGSMVARHFERRVQARLLEEAEARAALGAGGAEQETLVEMELEMGVVAVSEKSYGTI